MEPDIRYQIPQDYVGHKFAEFLRNHGWSRQNMMECKNRGMKPLFEGEEVRFGDVIPGEGNLTVKIVYDTEGSDFGAEDLPFEVVYEDRDILVAGKPPHMAIQPTRRHQSGTLGNAVLHYYKDIGHPFVYRCINRLDKDTSGLIIIAKHFIAASVLYDLMVQKKIQKEYLAIVQGSDIPDEDVIDLPIARKEEGNVERVISADGGQHAVTCYRVLERRENAALVLVRTLTGRTHQIRVHMKAIGHPLLGDALYNPGNTELPRQGLHARGLTFPHPMTGEELVLTASLPEDMRTMFPDTILPDGVMMWEDL